MNLTPKDLQNRVWQDWHYFISFGFGSGLSPKAPGTIGTIAALPVYLLICNLSHLAYLGLTVVGFFIGVKIIDIVSQDLGIDDYSGIVWDEIIGFLFVMYSVPISTLHILLGFGLFRLFDIWKPFPIRWLDKHLKGGMGVMLDDFIAAIFAWVVLQIIIRIIHL